MKWLFRRNKKEKPAVGNTTGNKHLTQEEKNARIEAQEMAKNAADEAMKIAPKVELSLEESMEYIKEDEYLEITPVNLRMRKI